MNMTEYAAMTDRELNRAIAERVFDWTITYAGPEAVLGIRAGHSVTKEVPRYSTDPGAMMEVVKPTKRPSWLRMRPGAMR